MSGASIRFRSLERSDYSLLAGWFSEPDVERWWNADASVEGIEAKYGPRIDGIDAATTMWIIEIGDHAGGLAQHYGHCLGSGAAHWNQFTAQRFGDGQRLGCGAGAADYQARFS